MMYDGRVSQCRTKGVVRGPFCLSWSGAPVVVLLLALACARTSPVAGGATPAVSAGQANPAVVAPPPPGKNAAPPGTADACRACNGLWAVHGLAQAESCVCRTTDGGKVCRDGADCQGMCLAGEVPEREIVHPGPPARGFFLGRCSDLVTVFGCNRIIERGAAAGGPAVLGDPPGALCVD